MESSIVKQQLEQGATKQDILFETAIEYYLTTGQYPTKSEIRQMGTAIDKMAQDKSFLEKAKSFASEHPILSGLAVGGTVIGAVLLSRTKVAKALLKKLASLFKETPEGKVGDIELANKRVRQALEASNRKALPESPEFSNLPAVVKPDIYKDIKQFASKNTAVHAAMRRIAREGRGLTSEQADAINKMLNKPPSIEDKFTQYMRSANN
jgi:hypothetical protein